MAPPNPKRPPRPGDPPADGSLRRKATTEVDLPEVDPSDADLPFDTSDLDLPFDTGEVDVPFGATMDADLPFETADLELPFDTAEVTPLRLDDPSPQHVTQYPVGRGLKKSEQVPTEVMQRPGELAQSFTPRAEQTLRPVFLYVERGPGAGQLVPVRQGRLVVGRSSSSDLRLQHPSVSRRHAEVTRTGERFFVKDLSSQNGTFVNKTRLLAEREIFPGDTLGLGTAVLKLRGPMSEAGLEKTQAGRARRGMWLALFACAVGFGMAGILFSALLRSNASGGAPSAPPAPVGQPPEALASAPRQVKASVPAEAPRPPEPSPASEVRGAGSPTPIAVAQASDPTPLAAPAPGRDGVAPSLRPPAPHVGATPHLSATQVVRADRAPSAAPAVRRRAPARRTTAPHRTTAPAPLREAPEPMPEEAPSGDAAALQAYRDGELSDALRGASGPLRTSLTRFQAAYDAGRRALAAHDPATATRHFDRALDLDRAIAHGEGTFHRILVHELKELKLMQADPAPSAPARAPAPSRSAIDEAFGD